MGKKKKKKDKKKKKGLLARAADAVSSMTADGVVESGIEMGSLAASVAALLKANAVDDDKDEDRELREKVEAIVDERIRETLESREFRALVRDAAGARPAARRTRKRRASTAA